MFMPFIEEKKVISQLRLGYTLNDYRHKIGLEESPNCTCGEIETVVHFICDCEEYEEERQKLLTQMFYLTGAQVISAEIFLSLKEEIFKEHRESLLMLLRTQSFFSWSPRTIQNLIVNPSLISSRTPYNAQRHLSLSPRPNLTAKVQEVSIDQTWFKTHHDPRESSNGAEVSPRTQKDTIEADTTKSFETDEEIIEKQTVRENKNLVSENVVSLTLNEVSNENLKNNLEKVVKSSQNNNSNAKRKRAIDYENLNRIEHLIIHGENTTESDKLESTGIARNTRPTTTAENKIRTIQNRDVQLENSRSDSRTTSVCSTCSNISTVPSRSRCSSGDGCSSVECDHEIQQSCLHDEKMHKRNYTLCYFHGPSCLEGAEEPVHNNNFCKPFQSSGQPVQNSEPFQSLVGPVQNSHFCKPFQSLGEPVQNSHFCKPFQSPDVKTSFTNQEIPPSHNELSPDVLSCSYGVERLIQTKCRQLEDKTLHDASREVDVTDSQTQERCSKSQLHNSADSQMQLLFYVIKLHIGMYRELKFLIEAQQKSLTLQGQSINKLIQCLMLLSFRLQQQTHSLNSLTAVLKQREDESRRRQRMVIFTVLAFVVIYILQLKSVQGRLSSFFRMFGFARQLKSFRRARTAMSEIWRDIPPLLTNFWRIFIFKGRIA